MSRVKSNALLGLVESEDEDTSEILGPAAQVKRSGSMPPVKRGRPPSVNRAGKPGTRPSSVATMGRKALGEKSTNAQLVISHTKGKKRPATDSLDIADRGDAADEDQSGVDPQQRTKARGRPRAIKVAKLSDEEERSIVQERSELGSQPARRGRKPKAQVAMASAKQEIRETQYTEPEIEIPETQAVHEFADNSIEDDLDEQQPLYNRTTIPSAQRQTSPAFSVLPFNTNRRPIAISESADSNDPSLRRRIGELIRKYEVLETKYRDLREVGIKEAERNYDKLKKQGEDRANTADQLIETLRAQLAAQVELVKEGERLKQRLVASEDKVAGLQSKVAEITGSLSEAKTEIKSLSTKLTASRAAEAASVKVPNSAMKGNNVNNRLIANAESAVQSAQMKEDLYADFTGLIIRAVKRENDDEVYDCIQTGRNGTLHFKLSVTPEEKSEEFDEAQFMYMPQLDPSRDQDLMDILPDYLVEEISFPRTHAAKFYSRVMRTLTERLE
ncbi:chromosome segregation protein Csm1/Pcs1-domain-containing protein [Xylariales sp. PMI_506]|nr:chromosome segregation protein Csm1/Pcs1-domain-containing protein [Xylariales sp. PMI_506]